MLNGIKKTFNRQFAEDVALGLSSYPKTLPSKYFYDDKGDRIFQQIMKMPEYYLTRCELEIITAKKAALLQDFGYGPFNLIELGAGDGTKTKVLLRHLLRAGADFQYFPIDISGAVLKTLQQNLQASLPRLNITPMQGDYFNRLKALATQSTTRNIVLFLGSSIGNFNLEEAGHFVEKIGAVLNKGDLLLTGFDLKKDPQIILDAYNDPAGITREFNLNLLHRINRELGGHFNVKNFNHWETYDPVTGAAKSFLISLKDQEVQVESLDTTFTFARWETIQTEISQKFTLNTIRLLATAAGFRVLKNYTDTRQYFEDSLWQLG